MTIEDLQKQNAIANLSSNEIDIKQEYEAKLKRKATMKATVYDVNKVNGKKSFEAGHIIYDKVTYIKRVSLEQEWARDVYVDKWHDKYMEEYAYPYSMYIKRKKMLETGTDITDWVGLDHVIIEQLEAVGIFTVEQISAISQQEANNSKIRDMWNIVQCSQQYVVNKINASNKED